MLIREITSKDKSRFDAVATHPLQSYGWGEFRRETGLKVERVGIFEGKKLTQGVQVTIHPLPKTKYTVGYFPKGTIPNDNQLKVLTGIGKRNQCLLIKIEPNLGVKIRQGRQDAHQAIKNYLLQKGFVSGRPLFTNYSFQINLRESEENLLARMKSKTRYNIRVAQRRGVTVKEENSAEAFEEYLDLLKETTARQQFYAHSLDYHRKMWKELRKAGIARLLVARFQGKMLVAWVVFVFNNVLYYPYGASSSAHRDLMASNLIMWEAMRYGKKLGCNKFDLWGALGPDASPKDPWFGFHRFKQGFGGDLIEFLGTYDLVFEPRLYKLYRLADAGRWAYLRAKARFLKIQPQLS